MQKFAERLNFWMHPLFTRVIKNLKQKKN